MLESNSPLTPKFRNRKLEFWQTCCLFYRRLISDRVLSAGGLLQLRMWNLFIQGTTDILSTTKMLSRGRIIVIIVQSSSLAHKVTVKPLTGFVSSGLGAIRRTSVLGVHRHVLPSCRDVEGSECWLKNQEWMWLCCKLCQRVFSEESVPTGDELQKHSHTVPDPYYVPSPELQLVKLHFQEFNQSRNWTEIPEKPKFILFLLFILRPEQIWVYFDC